MKGKFALYSRGECRRASKRRSRRGLSNALVVRRTAHALPPARTSKPGHQARRSPFAGGPLCGTVEEPRVYPHRHICPPILNPPFSPCTIRLHQPGATSPIKSPHEASTSTSNCCPMPSRTKSGRPTLEQTVNTDPWHRLPRHQAQRQAP